jgi:hypothetical protein
MIREILLDMMQGFGVTAIAVAAAVIMLLLSEPIDPEGP